MVAAWNHDSNYLVVVAVPDEASLRRLSYAAEALGIEHLLVEEPDYGGQATALALAPVEFSRRICSQFPLALKEKVMT